MTDSLQVERQADECGMCGDTMDGLLPYKHEGKIVCPKCMSSIRVGELYDYNMDHYGREVDDFYEED